MNNEFIILSFFIKIFDYIFQIKENKLTCELRFKVFSNLSYISHNTKFEFIKSLIIFEFSKNSQ